MDAAGPKPTAANPGTLLSVEDLFFNMPLRKKVRLPPRPVPDTVAVGSCCFSCLSYSAPHLLAPNEMVVQQCLKQRTYSALLASCFADPLAAAPRTASLPPPPLNRP